MARIPKPPLPAPPTTSGRPPPCPFPEKPPGEGGGRIEPNLVKDPEIELIFKQYLRPDYLAMPKLLLFILRYCDCRNSSQASREAGLSNGSYYRTKPEVNACIEAITARMAIKYGYDGHDVIERVKEISELDPLELENPDGTFKMLREIAPEVRRAIRKFKAKNIYGEDMNGMRTVTGQLIEVEFWDKQKAQEMLGSEKNIFKKTTVVQHDVTTNMKDVLLESSNRAEERLRLLAAREVGDSGGVQGEEESGGDHSGGTGDGVSVGVDGSSDTWSPTDIGFEDVPRGEESS